VIPAGLLSIAAFAAPSLNAMTVEELDALPMLGPEKAHRLVDWRQAHGPCGSLDDLLAIPGFGPATVAALRGVATCAEAPAPESAPDAPHPNVLSVEVVDLNTATAERLTHLPGITPGRAAAIVANREQAGPFESCEDLARVPGIGPATVTNLRTGDRPGICAAR
jgi:competence protein ComEA